LLKPKSDKEQAERSQAAMEWERENARAQAAIRDKLAADARAERQQRIAELQEKAAPGPDRAPGTRPH